jgi:hypothetical protein
MLHTQWNASPFCFAASISKLSCMFSCYLKPKLSCQVPWMVYCRSWLHRLHHNRAAAAALKLWLGMSGLVVLFILLAEDPQGTIHPTVSYAVMTVPTHGVIALVLAWHERVESTLIRVSEGDVCLGQVWAVVGLGWFGRAMQGSGIRPATSGGGESGGGGTHCRWWWWWWRWWMRGNTHLHMHTADASFIWRLSWIRACSRGPHH